MPEVKTEIEDLKKADDVFDRFVATLSEYDVSLTGAGALTLQLFGGVQRRVKGRSVRGRIHLGFVASSKTNIAGLVSHLAELRPNSKIANASNSTYTGLTGPVRSLGPDSGWYLDFGALTDDSTDFLAIQNPEALDEKTVSCLKEAVGSGSVTISKKGYHETVSANASLLLIGHPEYGDWDQYMSLADQVTIPPALASRIDLVFADIDGREERPEAPHIGPDIAQEYIRHARENCSPSLTTHADNELFEGLVEIHIEGMQEDSVPQAAKETVRRMAEASARTRLAEEVSVSDAQRAITIYRRPFEDLHGIDYEAPKFDSSLIPGKDTERKRKRRLILQAIVDGGKMSREEIIEEGRAKGLEKWEIDQIIGELRGRGDIHQDINDNWLVPNY